MYFYSTASRRVLPKMDPRKDFKFFLARAKVCQVYREALQEASAFTDPEVRDSMRDLIREQFRVFRPVRQDWTLDLDRIDYELALIRKQINMLKELRDRVA